MNPRINFKFSRHSYAPERKADGDEQVKSTIQTLMTRFEISTTRMYTPTRNSIKVIFPSEQEMNKVLNNKQTFLEKNLTPHLSLATKAKRTIFCAGFDMAITNTYDKEEIKEDLKSKGWNVIEVYILNNNHSLKIEFDNSDSATKFLRDDTTSIGGIFLSNRNKEREIDPSIPQCWCCGHINPGHSSNNCNRLQVCLKCGDRGHKFYECFIPRKTEDMTHEQKRARLCIPCGNRGDHTSMDHAACPKKREIVRERAKLARESDIQEQKTIQRDTNLIKTVLDTQKNDIWPQYTHNPNHTKITSLVALALIDDAVHPGSFSENFKNACTSNGLPEIKYKPAEGTAKAFFKAITGNPPEGEQGGELQLTTPLNQDIRTSREHINNTHHNNPSTSTPAASIFSLNTLNNQSSLSKFYKDTMGGKRPLPSQLEWDYLENSQQQTLPNTPEKRPRHLTQTSTPTQGATGFGEGGSSTKKINQSEVNNRLEALRKELQSVPINFRCKKPHQKIDGTTVARIGGLAKILETTKLNHSEGWTNALKEDLAYLVINGLGETPISYNAMYNENPHIENTQVFY